MTEALDYAATAEKWGPLAEPIHPNAASASDPVWKDNAFIAFWDIDALVFGSVHVSTSPNSKNARRRAARSWPRGARWRSSNTCRPAVL